MSNRRPLRTILLAVAAVLLLALAFVLFQANATTAPTEWARDPRNLRPLDLPAPPQVIDSTDHGDATPLYRAAIAAYLKDPDRYERFADTGAWESFKPADFPALALVLDAAPCAAGNIFKATPEDIVAYDRKPALDALRTLGRICTDRLALLALKHKDYDTARRYLEGGFAMGQRLANERLTYDELEAGFSLLGASTQGLALLAEVKNDPARADALRRYDQARLAFFREHITPTIHILRSIDANIVGDHAGDIPVLALDSQEPLWRTEAILSLGRMRFFTGTARAGDQRASLRTLQKLSRSSDETIQTAAKAALALTAAQYRSQQ